MKTALIQAVRFLFFYTHTTGFFNHEAVKITAIVLDMVAAGFTQEEIVAIATEAKNAAIADFHGTKKVIFWC